LFVIIHRLSRTRRAYCGRGERWRLATGRPASGRSGYRYG
jgi:hypothetical protein